MSQKNIFKEKAFDATLSIKTLIKECTWNDQGKIPWSIWHAKKSIFNCVCCNRKEDDKAPRSPLPVGKGTIEDTQSKNSPQIIKKHNFKLFYLTAFCIFPLFVVSSKRRAFLFLFLFWVKIWRK